MDVLAYPLAYPLAFLLGLAFNFNPSCGSATAVWVATQKETHRLILLVSIRIAIFAAMGAAAGLVGAALRPPWGALMLATAAYLLFSTVRQLRHGAASTCSLPHGSQALPWLLAAAPPPSAYIGLAIFFGGFDAPSPLRGALILTAIGLGLSFPVIVVIAKPQLRSGWRARIANDPRSAKVQVGFQLSGAAVLTAVGLAFLLLQDFHRPLLEVL